MEFDLDMMALSKLRCKLWVILTFVYEIKHDSIINTSTDQAVFIVFFVPVVKVNEVDKPDGRYVDCFNMLAVLVEEYHLEVSRYDQI